MSLKKLPPPKAQIETLPIMQELIAAHRKLGELKGYCDVVPNKNLLVSAITLNEAKDSSAIENIVTTHDELFRAQSSKKHLHGPAKEVLNYREALWHGCGLIEGRGFLSTNMLVDVQAIIEGNQAGIRKQGGTVLMNERTGEVVYTPPATEGEIRDLLSDLEEYINGDDKTDDLVKMAVIHYQFVSIHPFYDGNGRTGRILNTLYLVMKKLMDSPILYLSHYIMESKAEYYRLLNEIHLTGNWEEWILYMIRGVRETSERSLVILRSINRQMEECAELLQLKAPHIYSHELVELLFTEFYTRISTVEERFNITRKTASNHLHKLVELGILEVETSGREKLFVNRNLLRLFQ